MQAWLSLWKDMVRIWEQSQLWLQPWGYGGGGGGSYQGASSGQGVLEVSGALGPLLKSLAPSPPRQFSDSAWALRDGKPGSHAGLPERKPVMPRWPQDNVNYTGGRGGCWAQPAVARRELSPG